MCDTIPESYGKCVFCEGDWHVVERTSGEAGSWIEGYWFWHVCFGHSANATSYDMPWLVDFFKNPKDHPDWHCCSCRKNPPESTVAVYSLLEYDGVCSRMTEVLGNDK